MTHRATLDVKGRLVIPADLRSLLGDPVSIRRDDLPRLILQRADASSDFAIPVQKVGRATASVRVGIPRELRKYAGLSPGGEVQFTKSGLLVYVTRWQDGALETPDPTLLAYAHLLARQQLDALPRLDVVTWRAVLRLAMELDVTPQSCTSPGCHSPAFYAGLCIPHYSAWWKERR